MASPFTRLAAYIWRLFETDGVPASGAHQPDKLEIITWGTELENLLSDAPTRVGAQYQFSAETDTEEDPGEGYIRFNLLSPAPEGVTEIAVSDFDKFGLSMRNFWASLDDSSTLANRATLIIRAASGDFSAIFRVDAASILESGWIRLAVAWVDGTGTFVDDEDVGIVALPTGDEGGTKIAISVFDTGGPVGGESLWRAPLPQACTFLAGLTESFAYCAVAPTADAVFSVRRAEAATPNVFVAFATVTFSAGQTVGVFACATDFAFQAGDVLDVVAPSPADLTLDRPTFTIVGHLGS